MSPLGILGGTFDPPHLGHLVLAEAARVQFGLERVLFIPAGDPYHRRPGSGFQLASARPDLSSAAYRLAMTRLAVAGNDAFAADDRELRREGPSYTVDTLAELASELSEGGALGGQQPAAGSAGAENPSPLYLLLGADAAAELSRWKDPLRIAALATIAVAPRGEAVPEAPPGWPPSAGRWQLIDCPRIDITSTLVRDRIRAGQSVRYLVPDAVAAYVAEHGLYLAS